MISRRHILAASAALALCTCAMAQEVTFNGCSKQVISLTPERNTGLDKLFVVYNMAEVSEMRIAVAGSNVTISKYSNLGGGYAQEVPYSIKGSYAVVSKPEGDMGYIVDVDGRPAYFWVVNYQNHKFSLLGVQAASEQGCESTELDVTGEGGPIHYYSIDGRQCELSRDVEVSYYTLEWSDDSENFVQVRGEKTLSHLSQIFSVTPPIYCSTVFDVSGDRFLTEWGMAQTAHSPSVAPNGVAVHTSAEQTNLPAEPEEGEESEGSNLIKTEVQGIGGSAPVEVAFKAWTTDAVAHNEWQMASDEQFEYIDYRFNEQNLDYTFNEEGTYYIRFVGSNSDGSCEAVGETFTVSVGSSELKIPNAFTPNGDGINDVWKVAYRSLLDFSCSIFDRYGTQLYHFSDPSQGWDGKYKGKYVKPGVYFYVIEAHGADGKKYKKAGDINIIRSKKYGDSENSGSAETVTE